MWDFIKRHKILVIVAAAILLLPSINTILQDTKLLIVIGIMVFLIMSPEMFKKLSSREKRYIDAETKSGIRGGIEGKHFQESILVKKNCFDCGKPFYAQSGNLKCKRHSRDFISEDAALEQMADFLLRKYWYSIPDKTQRAIWKKVYKVASHSEYLKELDAMERKGLKLPSDGRGSFFDTIGGVSKEHEEEYMDRDAHNRDYDLEPTYLKKTSKSG